MRKFPLIPAAATAIVLVATVVFAQQATIKPVVTVKQIMQTKIVPSSDAVFSAASEPPKTAAAWTALRDATVTLADAAKLLMTKTHARDNEEWMTMAREQVNAAQIVMKAVAAKNADALSEAGDALYETCASCHARYMNTSVPPAK